MFHVKKISCYPEALLQIASEQNTVDVWCEQVDKMREILKRNLRFVQIISEKQISIAERKQLIDTVFGEKNEFDPMLIFFLKVLVDNNVFAYVCNIFHKFIELVDEKNDINYVKICSAFALNSSELERFQILLEKKFNPSRIKIRNVVDSSLICGAKIIAKSFTIDNSLKGKIEFIAKKILSLKMNHFNSQAERD